MQARMLSGVRCSSLAKMRTPPAEKMIEKAFAIDEFMAIAPNRSDPPCLGDTTRLIQG